MKGLMEGSSTNANRLALRDLGDSLLPLATHPSNPSFSHSIFQTRLSLIGPLAAPLPSYPACSCFLLLLKTRMAELGIDAGTGLPCHRFCLVVLWFVDRVPKRSTLFTFELRLDGKKFFSQPLNFLIKAVYRMCVSMWLLGG